VRGGDRAIDVAFGSEVDDGRRPVPIEGGSQRVAIADIGLEKRIGAMPADGIQRPQIGRVGELVDIEHVDAELAHEVAAHRRTDEARAPGDEYPHEMLPSGVQSAHYCAMRMGS
jgi:hypothetical protein